MPSFEEDEHGNLKKINHVPFVDEQEMHDWLAEHPDAIQEDMFIVGSKLHFQSGKETDLLGIDKFNRVVIIEIKQKAEEPRKVIAQIIDYAARAREELNTDELNRLAKKYGTLGGFSSLRKKFENEFQHEFDDVNDEQKLYIVAEKIHEDTKRMADYLRGYKLEINCIELTKKERGDGKFQYDAIPIVGGKMPSSSHKSEYAPEKNYDWNFYLEFKGWEEKTVVELKRICDYISKYSKERGWKLYFEFNQSHVIFRRSPPELKEKFGDRRVIDLKSHYGNPDDKVRISFNRLKDKDEKPVGKFDYKYNTSINRWYFDIERDGKLDLSPHSDFEKVLLQAYNATAER